jgi:hypothetical protein
VNLAFLNPAFLLAALVAAIPVVIHLISRRKVETLDWSSLQFLKELERKRIRRVRLRQILLLIVRSLILLSAALALARPTLTGRVARGAGGHAKTSVAIVLDVSASMSRTGEGGDLEARAGAIAGEIAGLLDEGDQAFLVTAGSPPAAVLAEGTFSKDALAEALAETKPSWSSTDYPGAVALAAGLLGGARNLNREMYVIGDMQRTGWAARDGRPEQDVTAGTGLRVYVLPVVGPEGNLGVVSATVTRKYGGTPGLFSVSASIENRGRRSVDAPLRLFVDGVQVGQAGVVVEPGQEANASFSTAVDETGWHSGSIELPVDALEADNRESFVIPPRTTTEVLVVEPEPLTEGDDGAYIARALDPTGGGERFNPVVVSVSALARQDEGRFPVVILADAGRLEGDAERWLDRHLAEGGGVLVILGSRTDIRYWNEGTAPGADGVTLREPVERAGGVRIAPSGQGHPLLEGLVFGDRLIDDVFVRRTFRADVSGAEEVLELPGIGPLLMIRASAESPSGSPSTGSALAGEVAILLTGVDPGWSDLPRSGLLVPLVHRLVDRLEGSRARAHAAVVGEDLAVPLDAATGGQVDVTLPDGTTRTATPRSDGRPGAVVERAPMPGIYRFVAQGREVGLGAVNVDPRESDLAAAGETEITESLRPLECRFIAPGGEIENRILEARYGRELWRVFVYVALGLVALEMVLARTRVT